MSRTKKNLSTGKKPVSEPIPQEQEQVYLRYARALSDGAHWVQPTLSGSDDAFRRILDTPATNMPLSRKPPFPDYTKQIVVGIALLAFLLVFAAETYLGQAPNYSLGLILSVVICLGFQNYTLDQRRKRARKHQAQRVEIAQKYPEFFSKTRIAALIARYEESH